ncbi:hypothetical protein ATANTOWER_003871, partial [Ataeniobius toweri]|nr:hypothetical protein [Ataeniobius toweri]
VMKTQKKTRKLRRTKRKKMTKHLMMVAVMVVGSLRRCWSDGGSHYSPVQACL